MADRATPRQVPRPIVGARAALGCAAALWPPSAIALGVVLGSMSHLDATASRAGAWVAQIGYGVLGVAIGLLGVVVSVATVVALAPGRPWSRWLGLGVAAGLVGCGFLVPGVALAACLLDARSAAWLAGEVRGAT